MIKNLTCICVIFSLVAGWSTGEELPPEVERLISKRNEAVSKIDRKMVLELERLKLQYMKSGNLEAANKTLKLIDSYTNALLQEDLAGKWMLYDTKNPNLWSGIITITNDLNYSCQGPFGTPNREGSAGKGVIKEENNKLILGPYEFDTSTISTGKIFLRGKGDPRTLERIK